MKRWNGLMMGVLALVFVCTGCAGKKINMVSERDLSISAADALEHSKDVMNDYGFDIRVIDPEGGTSRIEGDHVDGQKVEIDIVPESGANSHIKVKVTNNSPRASAKNILDDIAVRYK